MYSKPQLLLKYLEYFFTAENGKGHGIHSPFVFEFVTKVLNDKTRYHDYAIAEALRDQMKSNMTGLTIKDFGAGSVVSRSSKRSVASIARHTVKPKKYGQLIYRMARFYKPSTMLELGTSLGITTTYLAMAQHEEKIITMEGATEVAAIARKNFELYGFKNIQVVEGNFDDTLSGVVKELPTIDFAFIDGNHRQEPTERYFHQLLSKTHNDTILVFDDIHWSSEMEAAWEQIKSNDAVTCSIDLFFIGIVIFRNEFKEKQHFVIRF